MFFFPRTDYYTAPTTHSFEIPSYCIADTKSIQTNSRLTSTHLFIVLHITIIIIIMFVIIIIIITHSNFDRFKTFTRY